MLDKDTILLLEPLELSYYNEEAYPKIITHNGDSDLDVMELRAGHNQSLMHAINAGALEPFIENKKVILNLLPRWFIEAHIGMEIFESRFADRINLLKGIAMQVSNLKNEIQLEKALLQPGILPEPE